MKANAFSRTIRKILGTGAALSMLCCSPLISQSNRGAESGQANSEGANQVQRIAAAVYKEIVTLPQYGVFDHLHFAIKGTSTVILRGEASRPILKSSAENVTKRIEALRK